MGNSRLPRNFDPQSQIEVGGPRHTVTGSVLLLPIYYLNLAIMTNWTAISFCSWRSPGISYHMSPRTARLSGAADGMKSLLGVLSRASTFDDRAPSHCRLSDPRYSQETVLHRMRKRISQSYSPRSLRPRCPSTAGRV